MIDIEQIKTRNQALRRRGQNKKENREKKSFLPIWKKLIKHHRTSSASTYFLLMFLLDEKKKKKKRGSIKQNRSIKTEWQHERATAAWNRFTCHRLPSINFEIVLGGLVSIHPSCVICPSFWHPALVSSLRKRGEGLVLKMFQSRPPTAGLGAREPHSLNVGPWTETRSSPYFGKMIPNAHKCTLIATLAQVIYLRAEQNLMRALI